MKEFGTKFILGKSMQLTQTERAWRLTAPPGTSGSPIGPRMGQRLSLVPTGVAIGDNIYVMNADGTGTDPPYQYFCK